MSDRPVAMREPGGPAGGMLCPVCGVALVMAEKQGVEIDYCPKCRGIWLDRGEIDKIVERSLPPVVAAPAPRAAQEPAPGRRGESHDGYSSGGGHSGREHGGGHGSSHGYGTNRRRSWLSDLFD